LVAAELVQVEVMVDGLKVALCQAVEYLEEEEGI